HQGDAGEVSRSVVEWEYDALHARRHRHSRFEIRVSVDALPEYRGAGDRAPHNRGISLQHRPRRHVVRFEGAYSHGRQVELNTWRLAEADNRQGERVSGIVPEPDRCR